MWYLDLNGGFSHTGVCEALLAVSEKRKKEFTRLFFTYVEHDAVLYKKTGTGEKATVHPLLLKEHYAAISPLDTKRALTMTGDLSPLFSTMFARTEEKVIDAFDMTVYLTLLIILEKLMVKQEIRMLSPRIGTGSPGAVFHILNGFDIFLDPRAPDITPMCAAFFSLYPGLFVPDIQGTLNDYMTVTDPLNKNIRMQLFQCHDPRRDFDAEGFENDIVGVLETNIDDTTPEIMSGVMTELLRSGALDYTINPVMMKKGRSGFHIQVLCRQKDMEIIAGALLMQTSSFGLRMQTLVRKKVKREIRTIQTPYGNVRIKVGYKGNTIIKAAPEFDDLKTIAAARGMSLFHLYNEIMGEMKKGIDCFNKDDKITRL